MALTKILDGGMSSGSILQVVQGSKTDTFTSNSQTTFVDIGLSVTITPSFSSSKVLIVYRVCTGIVSGGYGCALILVRGSTNIALGDAEGNRTRVSSLAQSGNSSAAGYQVYYQAQDFLDSPNTTSATTYKLTARGWNSSPGSFYINRSATDSNTASHTRPISTITAMEIAG
tara:strand:+ start:37 stop:552 length:516 start_codon:yes stop_codon:yes gene_type:complete